jgi:transmembrane sensor
LDQIKLHVQQLVAEALTIMSKDELNSLPVYNGDRVVGKLTYDELIDFLDDNESDGSIYAHRLNFDIGSVLIAIRKMRNEKYKIPLQYNVSRRLVAGLSSAAAIGIVLLALAWVFFKPASPLPAGQNNTVMAGLNKVMLTLANGGHIALNDAKKGVVIDGSNLTYSDGTAVAGRRYVSEAGRGTALAISTSNGGMYQLTLPDGTKVWLNAASSLTFPASFAGANQRRVELTGEAYFEVAKNKKMPFIVESKGQEIEVLGTHFNVSAYGNEGSVKTTLLEGSVRVTPSYRSEKCLKSPDPSSLDPLEMIKSNGAQLMQAQAVVLTPNHQAILTGAELRVKEVVADEAVAWKNGEFIFRNMSLENIMKVVARWYDMDVSYQSTNAGKALLGGTISKSSKIAEVLKTLEVTANVHFKLDGRKITVIQ